MSVMMHILDPQKDEIIGYLDNNGDNIFWDDVHEQSVDGYNVFRFSMLTTTATSAAVEGRVRILIPHERGGLQEFIANEVITTMDTKEVHTSGAEIELNKLKNILPSKHIDIRLRAYVQLAVTDTGYSVGKIDSNFAMTLTFDKHLGAYDFLRSVAEAYDMELVFRVEVEDNRIVGRYVDVVERMGAYEGKEIEYGKDLLEIERKHYPERIITALLCIGPERKDGTRIITTVTDKDAYQRWNRNKKHLLDRYELVNIEQDATLAKITQLGQAELKRRIASIDEYMIRASVIEQVYPNEKVRLGDEVRTKNTEYLPPLYADARILNIKRSLTDPNQKEFVIGNVVLHKEEDILKTFRELQVLYGLRVIKSSTPPVGDSRIIWVKTIEGSDLEVAHTWNGSQWIAITPTRADQVGAETPEGAQDKADQAKEQAKEYAESRAEYERLQGHAVQLLTEKAGYEQQYIEAYNAPTLYTVSIKTALQTAWNAYLTAFTNLYNAITLAANDEAITQPERDDVETKTIAYRVAVTNFSAKHSAAVKDIAAGLANDAEQAATDFTEMYAQKEITQGLAAPSNPVKGDLWIDTSLDPYQWKQWNGSQWKILERTNLDQFDGQIDTSQIAPNAVTTDKLVDGVITTIKLGNLAVDATKIANNAITSTKILDGAIADAKIAAGAVTSGKIFDGAITNAKLAALAVDAAKLAGGAVTEVKLATGAVTNAKLAALAVDATKLADGAVTVDKVGAGAITNAKLANLAVDAAKLANGAVTDVKVATGAITNTKLADLAVDAAKLANSSVTSIKIANLAVGTAAIAEAAITNAKLDRASVNKIVIGTADVADAAINSAKIGSLAVGTAAIQDSAITNAKIANLGVTTAKIDDAAITSAKIANLAVGNAAIANGAITNAKIGDAAITSAKIGDAQITAAKIAALAVGTAAIQDAAITNAKVGALDASKITTGRLDAARVQIGSGTEFAAGYDPTKIQVGGRNLFTNTSGVFNSTFVGWQEYFSSIKVDEYGLNELRQGGTFTIKGYIKNISGTEPVGFMIQCYTPNTAQGYRQFTSQGNAIQPNTEGYFEANYTLPQDLGLTSVILATRHSTGNATSSTVEFMQVKLEKGNKATDWTPAPEDNPALLWQFSDTTFIDGGKIYANTITTNQIAVGTITAVQIAGQTITGDKIATNAITANKIAANTITAAEIATNAITADKLAANAVKAVNIEAGAVATDKLAANAVTAVKIAAGAIETVKLAANAVTADKIAANTITASQIASNTITSNLIATAGLDAGVIKFGTMSGSRIQSNTITTTQLAANSVTATELNVTTLSAISGNLGTITSGNINIEDAIKVGNKITVGTFGSNALKQIQFNAGTGGIGLISFDPAGDSVSLSFNNFIDLEANTIRLSSSYVDFDNAIIQNAPSLVKSSNNQNLAFRYSRATKRLYLDLNGVQEGFVTLT